MKYPYGKVIVITGASAGIGKACVRLFAERGFHVWALSRKADESRQTVGDGTITTARCDVRDEESVRTAMARVMEAEGEIGIILHCAGFGVAGPQEEVTMEAARAQFETNYFGVLQVNQAVLPHMRARKRGLVLIVGSVAGLLTLPFQGHYSASKYALEAATEALRIEGRPLGIRACIIEPGDTKTEFTQSRETKIAEDSPYRDAGRHAIARQSHDEQHGYAPEKVARVTLRLAQRRRPPVRRAVGFGYKTIALLCRVLPSTFIEFVLRKMYTGR